MNSEFAGAGQTRALATGISAPGRLTGDAVAGDKPLSAIP
jgi:hypothetical protein